MSFSRIFDSERSLSSSAVLPPVNDLTEQKQPPVLVAVKATPTRNTGSIGTDDPLVQASNFYR